MSSGIQFGQWLKRSRRAWDLTQDELAERIDCSWETIRKIETGLRRPSKQVAELLASFFNIPTDEVPSFVHFARSGESAASSQFSIQSLTQPLGEALHSAGNLPAERSSFIGRERPLAAAAALISRPEVRLLTLSGAPGIGKTRLSLRLAAELLPIFSDGVFFVSLSTIRDPDLVAPAIMQALGIKETPTQEQLAYLKSYLRRRNVLLVLDNFEQVLSASAVVAELITACPQLKVVVTSRAVLRLYGEHEFSIPPMELPNRSRGLRSEALEHCESVDLFIQRARAVQPDFTLTPENAPVVVEICHQLDGLPLAIELAAARLNILSPQAILANLSSRLAFLTSGAQDLPDRQRTLRDAIAWSYDLLDDADKLFFRRLSVFVGGCALEAVTAMLAVNMDTELPAAQPGSVFESLSSLVDKSLLIQERTSGAEPRYTMLETISEYALVKLNEAGEYDVARHLHARHYLHRVEQAEPGITSPERGIWLARLDTDINNLRAALEWYSQEESRSDLFMSLAAALGWYWLFRGLLSDGRVWLEKSLQHSASALPSSGRARALSALGRLAFYQGDFTYASTVLNESVSIFRELEDWRGLAFALAFQGVILAQQGDPRGYDLAEESTTLFRRLGDTWGLAYSLDHLAAVAIWLGNLDEAVAHYSESLDLHRQLGGEWDIAHELGALGRAALLQADYPAARVWLEEALTIQQQVGDRWDIAQSIRNLGDVALCQADYGGAASYYGQSLEMYQDLLDNLRTAALCRNLGHALFFQEDYDAAERMYRRGFSLYRDMKHEPGMVLCLVGYAGILRIGGQLESSIRLLALVETLCVALRIIMAPADHIQFEHNLNMVRGMLDPEVFSNAWEAGRAMTMDEAADYCLQAYAHLN